MSIGSFTLIKNESQWIAGHLLAVLPHVDEMCFFDGNSTDGTLEIIKAIKADHPNGDRITLVEDRDPVNLEDDYVRLFNECMRTLKTDLAWFLHPDMIPEKMPETWDHLANAISASTAVRSFAGEPDGQLYEMTGRCPVWKNIYRLRNPDLGAHYHGHYGHEKEDVYFSGITGSQHVFHESLARYPYPIIDSGVKVLHFSDVRPHERRVSRMTKCLLNNNWTQEEADAKAKSHARVTFKDGGQFKFIPSEYPPAFLAAQEKYRHLVKEPAACL